MATIEDTRDTGFTFTHGGATVTITDRAATMQKLNTAVVDLMGRVVPQEHTDIVDHRGADTDGTIVFIRYDGLVKIGRFCTHAKCVLAHISSAIEALEMEARLERAEEQFAAEKREIMDRLDTPDAPDAGEVI